MLDLAALGAAIEAEGRVARIVILSVAGSAPRGTGTAMLVWETGQSGTIGGGALEWQAVREARAMLATGGTRVDHLPLGPALGQCCGGAVVLATEVWDQARLDAIKSGGTIAARRLAGTAEMPLALRRALARARDRGTMSGLIWQDGWLAEALSRPSRELWIWGAGHVGRAMIAVLAPLPDIALHWIDTDAGRFPAQVPDNVTLTIASDPGVLVPQAPDSAEHLIVTYSHALDLDLCHRLLRHGFGSCGLIGSASKWARFRSRLTALGHDATAIARIRCPIGDPALGKDPQAIAIGVAAELLRPATALAWKDRA